MGKNEEKAIERVFDDAMERAWEEAKLRDLMTLYYMWQNREFDQFKTFKELFEKFYKYDDKVRNLDERQYFNIEHLVVDTICNASDDFAKGLCGEREEK